MSEPELPPHDCDSAEDERALALRLLVILSRAAAAVARRTEADIARHDLSPGEFAILEVLHHKGPLQLNEVQRRILVSSGGITYLVDRLERQGLVERRACPGDRRARHATLTEKGEALMHAIFPAHVDAIVHATAALDADEKRQAIALLRKLGLGAAR